MAGASGTFQRGQAGRAGNVQRPVSTCCRMRTSSLPKPRPAAFLADLRKDPIRWRATLYGWIAGFCQASEFRPSASTCRYCSPWWACRRCSATISSSWRSIRWPRFPAGWAADHAEDRAARYRNDRLRRRVRRASDRRRSALQGKVYILPFGAAIMMCGQYCALSNCMTIPTMVAKPEYRGTASGFSYMFVKLAAFCRSSCSQRYSPPWDKPTPRCWSPSSR